METSLTELEKNLRNLGLRAGDALMVHASLRAVGPVETRAAGLVETLLAVLGEQGTLLTYVDFEPTDQIPYFDLQHSPACSEHGIFAEITRTWPGAIRSQNPGASMVAIGACAQWICREHPLNYGYGSGSPMSKLVDMKGKILLLGSSLDNVTILHHAEHLAKLPNKRVIRRTDAVRSKNTVNEIEIEEYDTSEPVVSTMPASYFAQITREFVENGNARTGRVGHANSVLLPSREFLKFAIEKMEREFG